MLKEWLTNDEIRFRTSLYASITPSSPRCGSYIVLSLADSRLCIHINNDTLNCLSTYDSDNKALQIQVLCGENDHPLEFLKDNPIPKYNYKKTNWKRFKNIVLKRLNENKFIPNCRNLTNFEIDFYVLKLNAVIIKAIIH